MLEEKIHRIVKSVITENKISKNMAKVRRYIRSIDSALNAEAVLNDIRDKIPNVRAIDYKYFIGVTRMYINGELNDSKSVSNVNSYLKIISSSQEYVNELDGNFNNMSYSEIDDMFQPIVRKILEKEKGELNLLYFFVLVFIFFVFVKHYN